MWSSRCSQTKPWQLPSEVPGSRHPSPQPRRGDWAVSPAASTEAVAAGQELPSAWLSRHQHPFPKPRRSLKSRIQGARGACCRSPPDSSCFSADHSHLGPVPSTSRASEAPRAGNSRWNRVLLHVWALGQPVPCPLSCRGAAAGLGSTGSAGTVRTEGPEATPSPGQRCRG